MNRSWLFLASSLSFLWRVRWFLCSTRYFRQMSLTCSHWTVLWSRPVFTRCLAIPTREATITVTTIRSLTEILITRLWAAEPRIRTDISLSQWLVPGRLVLGTRSRLCWIPRPLESSSAPISTGWRGMVSYRPRWASSLWLPRSDLLWSSYGCCDLFVEQTAHEWYSSEFTSIANTWRRTPSCIINSCHNERMNTWSW